MERGEGSLTISYILENIFSESNMKWYCKDINSIAMTGFNIGGFGTPFYRPIIDVKEVCVRGECILSHKTYNKEWEKVVALINSDNLDDINKALTVKQIIEKIKHFDKELELCSIGQKYDFSSYNWIPAFINILDGTKSLEGNKSDIVPNYKGIITTFIV